MLSLTAAGEFERAAVLRRSLWIGWIPLAVVPLMVIVCRDLLPAWTFMWILSLAIFVSLKWLTWWKARVRVVHPAWRSAAYLLAWPGMDAKAFLDVSQRVPSPLALAWVRAALKITLGAILLWLVARSIGQNQLLLRGWLGMLGLVLLLHFGAFEILALLWQSLGVNAKPIMSAPLRSTSLGDFWGKRWNVGFRQLGHELIFRPLHRSLGGGMAAFLVFVASGLIHDLVISLPARAGYGLPTIYFLFQGVGVTLEHSSFGKQFGLGSGWRGRLFMAVFVLAPLFWLFHPWFLLRVMLPFMQAIRAL